MAKKSGCYETHRFFCINCSNEGIPLMRKRGHEHPSFHMKKLYCPYCKTEVNHVECKNEEEVAQFKENFKNGVYIDDAEESLAYVRNSSKW